MFDGNRFSHLFSEEMVFFHERAETLTSAFISIGGNSVYIVVYTAVEQSICESSQLTTTEKKFDTNLLSGWR